MERHIINPRTNWQKIVESQGFVFHSAGGQPYWNESAFYSFREWEILAIEKATNELYHMCLEAVEYIISKKLYSKFEIPDHFIEIIEYSWQKDLPSIYGRFDLAYDGHQIKMLEFNADTPTSLLEASVIQWFWLQDIDARKDQFNSIHEKLIGHWKFLAPYLFKGDLHFTCVKDSAEDYMTTAYMIDCAQQAGHSVKFIYIDDIGRDEKKNKFLGIDNEPITNIFKLYPYEWMVNEEFGKYLVDNKENTNWIEPAWKALLSNKVILKVLWEIYPNNPYLLKTDLSSLNYSYVRKPKLSREGANVQVVENGKIIAETGGEYGEEGYVYQEFFKIPNFDGNVPIIGSWVVGGEAAGMGIRESNTLITDNLSKFVPHYFY